MTLPRLQTWHYLLGAIVILGPLGLVLWRRWTRKAARRALFRFRARVDRFKLTGKRYILEALLADPAIAAAVEAHAEAHGVSRARTWDQVRVYLREIVPAFNLLMYYQFGYAISRTLLNIFYKTTVTIRRPEAFERLPRESIVIYLMNHRSNADYVLASYGLAGQVAISYAVGEWARVFPLEYLFKSFGSYFIRRRYREPLYHTVLERYVQLITRNGVTQGSARPASRDSPQGCTSCRSGSTTIACWRTARSCASSGCTTPRRSRRGPRSSARCSTTSSRTSGDSARGDGSATGGPPSSSGTRCPSVRGSPDSRRPGRRSSHSLARSAWNWCRPLPIR
jgi:hypothetical protein